MPNTEGGATAPLNDVMLAMDVVDTLRHNQTVVERELNEEEREKALIVRLREIYASQGIDVPDSVLAEGVSALKEDRFTYRAPEPGLGRSLAKLYVNRGRWGRLMGSLAVLAGVVWAGYFAFVSWPEARRVQEAATAQVQTFDLTSSRLNNETQRLERLQQAMATAEADVPNELQGAAASLVASAEQDLVQAKGQLASIQLPERPRSYDASLDVPIGKSTEVLAGVGLTLDAVETRLRGIQSLASLSKQLPSKQQAVLKVSKDPRADARANAILEAGNAALLSGDVEAASSAVDELDALLQQLNTSYELRVLNREGQLSGVFRVPPNNARARNYYLIIEALDSRGQPISVPVADEELGKTVTASVWGMRVSESVFNRIAADKSDDGIIQNNRFGQKEQGYLTPDYAIPTTGASITRW